MFSANLTSRRFWKKDLILICLVCCIASYPNSILTSVLPVYILDLGGTNSLTGFMTSGLTVLTILTNLFVAPMIDSIGRKKMVMLGSGLFFLNCLLFCFTKSLMFIVALRILCGFTTGVFFPVPPIMVADVADRDQLVDALGIFGASSAIAFAAAPSIGLWLYRTCGVEAMFVSSAACAGISFGITLFIGEHYNRPETVSHGNKGVPSFRFLLPLLGMMLMPMLVNMIANFSHSAVNTFITPCGLSRGLENISVFFIVNQVTCILVRLTIGSIVAKLSKPFCTVTGILLISGGILLISIAANMSLMLLSAVLIGIGITVITQIFQAENFSQVPSERRGIAGTAFNLSANVGSGIGASVWGSISTGMGYAFAYAAAGLAALLALIFNALYWKERRR